MKSLLIQILFTMLLTSCAAPKSTFKKLSNEEQVRAIGLVFSCGDDPKCIARGVEREDQ